MVIIISIPLVLFAWINSQSQAVDPNNTTQQRFVINRGESVSSIAERLSSAKLIRSPLALRYYLWRNKKQASLQAGSYSLSPAEDLENIIASLQQGKAQEFWVRILEGWRREEIAASLEDDYAKHSVSFKPQKFLELTEGMEGYLFPDSYLLPVDSATEELIAKLLRQTFRERVEVGLQTEIQSSNLDLHEVVTLASIVEREARQHESRRMVAGILINRLNQNAALQVDASLQYIRGYVDSEGWWAAPMVRFKDSDSLYNSYKFPGLPPGPIASPSLSSIKAVLDPEPSDYWYYITGNDNKMHYATSLDEHNANIQQYLR